MLGSASTNAAETAVAALSYLPVNAPTKPLFRPQPVPSNILFHNPPLCPYHGLSANYNSDCYCWLQQRWSRSCVLGEGCSRCGHMKHEIRSWMDSNATSTSAGHVQQYTFSKEWTTAKIMETRNKLDSDPNILNKEGLMCP